VPICPTCGEDNPERARFCLACASPLAGPLGPATRERKFATALFADLVGSTSLAEREDPEVVQSVVARAFDRLAAEIERHGGLVEKFMGDAVLAVFGVPTTHEDDPERAVRAALEMLALLAELNRAFADEGKPQLEMRIGIEAGEVLVDQDRAAGPRDRMLTGDAVNTAARLQAAAEPRWIVVGSSVHAATKDVIDYLEVGPFTLKGKAEPVPAWRAMRVSARRRGERPRLGLEASLVGRDEELQLLEQTYQRVVSERRPALVTVIGPAGVGKSRLSAELLVYLEGLPDLTYWRKGRCLAYGNVSYSALADAIKAQCEVLEDDTPDILADKVRRAVEELFGDESEAVLPQIQALVGTSTADRTLGREDLFDAWRRFLERMAARLPLVLVLEDLHWADAGLLDFVDHVADWAQGPILVLALTRPELLELRPAWGGGKRNYASIYLDPLSTDENGAMLDDLLGFSLPPELKQLIADRSEGNPLYTEEIVRMFIERGVLRAESSRWELAQPVDDIEVPRSIHALIATRLDGLPAGEKAVLQDAAVIGRAFWLGAVAQLSARPAVEVRDTLGRLRTKEIITPREPPVFSGELEFAFRHVLIRDVAYESLPKTLRAAKHVEVARWAEERAGDRSEELAEVVGAHYLAAIESGAQLGETPDRDVDAAACRWATMAGRRARRLWQQSEASRWFEAALDSGKRAGLPDGDLAELNELYATTLDGIASYDRVVEAYRTAIERYQALGREIDAGRMESGGGKALFNAGDDDSALEWMERAIRRLEGFGDSQALVEALETLGNAHRRRGRLHLAEPLLRKAVDMGPRMGASAPLAEAYLSLGIVLLHQGSVAEGMSLVERGYTVADEVGDLAALLRACNAMASCLMDFAPDYDRGWQALRRGIELSQKSGRRDHEGWMWNNVGNYAFDQGKLDELEHAAEVSVEIGRSLSYPHVAIAGHYLEALAMFLRGDVGRAEEVLAGGYGLDGLRREIQATPYVVSLHGEIARMRGDEEEALRWYFDGLEILGDELMLGMVDELLSHNVRLLVQAGRRAEAAPYLEQLRTVAKGRPNSEAFQWWAEGVFADSPTEGALLLQRAIERFGELGRPIDEARGLLDLARVELRAGTDPDATLGRARHLLTACGAVVYLSEADRILTDISD
jgi:class 3 adenylate cyclase/tetratricopeptide (TPR) repeat protein